MAKLIILNGYPRTGKDTFIKFCVQHLLKEYEEKPTQYIYKHTGHGTTYLAGKVPKERTYKYKIKRISTIDTPKRFFRKCGWNGIKTTEMRNGLSELKDLLTEYLDYSFFEITTQMLSKENDFVFTCVREPEEIQKLVDFCKNRGFECYSILMKGNEESLVQNSEDLPHSDKNVNKVNYALTFVNDSDINNLRYIAEGFVETYLKVG